MCACDIWLDVFCSKPKHIDCQGEKGGVQLLFDGKTLNGWHTYNKPGVIGDCWTVEDGVISFDMSKKERGDLITDAAFENYDFSVEWRISKMEIQELSST